MDTCDLAGMYPLSTAFRRTYTYQTNDLYPCYNYYMHYNCYTYVWFSEWVLIAFSYLHA